jgi:large subunit ribosomal protein L23
MAIFDIFKIKKKVEEKKEVHPVKSHKKGISPKAKLFNGVKKPAPGKYVGKEEKPKEKPVKKAKPIKSINMAYRILKTPHITEKATDLIENNQYIFKVYKNSNKQEVKKAIESVYGVDVVSVKMINIPRKRKRLGKSSGWKKGGKKAIVRIEKGQKIETVPR